MKRLGLAFVVALGIACAPEVETSPDATTQTAVAVPRVQPFGDSITYGVGSDQLAGWREGVYRAAAASGKPLLFVGSMSFGGEAGGLAVDPFNEGIPGIQSSDLNTLAFRIATFRPDVVLYAAGTNDLAGNVGNQPPEVVAQRISDGLDAIWAMRTGDRFSIALCTVLKRLDDDDAKVVALNALLPGKVASKPYPVTLIDMYAAIPSPEVGVNMHDPIHPNDVGYTWMAGALYPALAPMLEAR